LTTAEINKFPAAKQAGAGGFPENGGSAGAWVGIFKSVKGRGLQWGF